MPKTVWIIFVLFVFCILSMTMISQLGTTKMMLQYEESQQNVTTREAVNNTNNTTNQKLSEARYIHKPTKIMNPLQGNCNASKQGVHNSYSLDQNCNHQEVTEYFLKHLLALDKALAISNGFMNATDNKEQAQNKNTTEIGILIPTTTRKVKCQDLLQFTLFEKSLPSILNTLSADFIYKIFIGFDASDTYFSTLYNQTQLNASTEFVWLVEVQCQTYVAAANTIAQVAYAEGVDYLVRINDDTEFTTSNWSNLAIEVLRKYDPPNVGVVGPTCYEGNTKILTHDMVHRTHLDIFTHYYPPLFENWWTDDWITLVYQPNRSTKLATWTVKHLLTESRYVVDWSVQNILPKAVREGEIKIHAYAPVFKKEN